MPAPNDEREEPRPLRGAAAALASAWLVLVSLLYLAVRELGLHLVP